MKHLLFTLSIIFCCSIASAQVELINLSIEGRSSDEAPVLQSKKSTDAINLILIPGGSAGTGDLANGIPSSLNFLVRSRNDFAAAGFNTYIIFRAKSVSPNAMATSYRKSKEHMKEIQSLVNHITTTNSGPIWLVGTSMGTISAVTAALQISNSKIKGVVLTASVTKRAPGHLGEQKLQDLKMPVLMIHHESDACFACVPSEAKKFFSNIGSPQKQFSMVSGGGPVSGDFCQNQHWHGFVGIENSVTSQIVTWIKGNS